MQHVTRCQEESGVLAAQELDLAGKPCRATKLRTRLRRHERIGGPVEIIKVQDADRNRLGERLAGKEQHSGKG
jgi:hypothetical protein